MTIQKYIRPTILLIVIVLLSGCFYLGEMTTAYANETSSANTIASYYIGRNTRRLFGLIFIGVVIFGAVKGWRRGVALGCFITFLGFASFTLFTYGQLIATWLNSSDTKLIPVLAFFVGGIICVIILHKLYKLMNAYLKEYLKK